MKLLIKRFSILFLQTLTLVQVIYAQDASTNIVNESENTEVINNEAVRSAQQGKYDQAIRQFKRIVSIQDQNVAATYNNIGYTFMLSGDQQQAIENYKKAVERNPGLVPALSNLGKLLYQTSDYQEAIKYGEKVIALDPRNANVRTWLPDAYKKAAEKRMFELDQLKKSGGAQVAEGKTDGKSAESEKMAKKPLSKIELSGGTIFQWSRPAAAFNYYDPGTTIPFPLGLSAEVWASPDIRISGEIKIPDPLMDIPTFVSSEENVSIVLHSNDNYYGIGIYFSQANFLRDEVYGSGDFITNSEFPKRNDTKLGVIFGNQKEFNSFIFYTYPRYLFSDGETNPQSIEYDRAITKIEYRVSYPEEKGRSFIPWHFELGFGLKTNEFFVTEYSLPVTGDVVGHYFGAYDLYVDLSFGKIQASFDKVPVQVGFLVGTRLYFEDLNNAEPFTFGNGQGFFGFDTDGAVSGDTFPTFRAISFLVEIYSRQLIFNKFVLFEKIGMELTETTNPFNQFSGTLGVSYTF